ncbi:MAG: hypothetical protein AB8B93_18295 [Pseudomonadales bacterium]
MSTINRLQAALLAPVLTVLLSSCSDSGTSTQNIQFSKERVKGCELVSAELVATTFAVPAENLKQTRMMGCIYTWDNEQDQLQASVMMARAHKNATAASAWFANATRNRTAAESQAEIDQVAERLESREELNATAGKSVTKTLLKAAGAKAVVYTDIANIGDEARAAADGSLWVRVGNLTVTISAYHGAKQPETQLSGLGIKEMIAAANEADSDWQAQTAPQRLEDSSRLANAIVARL